MPYLALIRRNVSRERNKGDLFTEAGPNPILA